MLSREKWWDFTQQIAAFHTDNELPFVWLPTPAIWAADLASQMSELRSKEQPPRWVLADKLFWYAWAPHEVMRLTTSQQDVWYTEWACAQRAGTPPPEPQVGSPDSTS